MTRAAGATLLRSSKCALLYCSSCKLSAWHGGALASGAGALVAGLACASVLASELPAAARCCCRCLLLPLLPLLWISAASPPDIKHPVWTCPVSRGVEQEVRQVVSKARLFTFKPDGEVTFRFAQDGNGMPAPTMQVREYECVHACT